MIDYGIFEIQRLENRNFLVTEQLEGKQSQELVDLRAVTDYIDYELEQIKEN